MPYIYYLLNKDYIAQNLCENNDKPELQCEGKCHLTKQLKKNSQKEKDPVAPITPNKLDIKLFWHSPTSTTIDTFKILNNRLNLIKNNPTFFDQTYLEISTPPPDFTLS